MQHGIIMLSCNMTVRKKKDYLQLKSGWSYIPILKHKSTYLEETYFIRFTYDKNIVLCLKVDILTKIFQF